MHKIIVVTRKTRLTELIYKYNTIEQAKFYIEHMGADFSDYVLEDKNYQAAVEAVRNIAQKYARVQEVDRAFFPSMILGKDDIVIAVGQDGLVANVMKYLDGHPLIGINPDTKRWDGQEMLAVNDLFIGQRTHTSAQYDIHWNENCENQSSSGIIVSTGLGATGWYKSIMAEARQIAGIFGCGNIADEPAGWSDDRLTFVVREPYPSKFTQAGIVYGKLGIGDNFKVVSKMAANGVVFSDGMESDAIEFNAGSEITVGIADKKGKLVVQAF